MKTLFKFNFLFSIIFACLSIFIITSTAMSSFNLIPESIYTYTNGFSFLFAPVLTLLNLLNFLSYLYLKESNKISISIKTSNIF